MEEMNLAREFYAEAFDDCDKWDEDEDGLLYKKSSPDSMKVYSRLLEYMGATKPNEFLLAQKTVIVLDQKWDEWIEIDFDVRLDCEEDGDL